MQSKQRLTTLLAKFEYNNTGYFFTFSRSLRRVTQQPFSVLLQSVSFAPLQMNDTFIVEEYPTINPIVSGYAENEQGNYELSEKSLDTYWRWCSTFQIVNDLMKWVKTLVLQKVGVLSLLRNDTTFS